MHARIFLDVNSVFKGLQRRFGSASRLDLAKVQALSASAFDASILGSFAIITRKGGDLFARALERFDFHICEAPEGRIDAIIVSLLFQFSAQPIIFITGDPFITEVLPSSLYENIKIITFEDFCNGRNYKPITKNWIWLKSHDDRD